MKQTKTKTLCLLLAALMLLSSLTACGKDKEKDSNLIKLGDYELLYKGACIMEDSDGNDAIVLSLDFTNNSKENQYTMGVGPNRDGIMLLLSMADRDWAMFCYGSHCEYAFNSYGQEKLEKVFLDNFGEDDWYGGFEDYVKECRVYLEKAANGKPVRASLFFPMLVVIGLSLLAAIAIVAVIWQKMDNVSEKTTANAYVAAGLRLTEQTDRFTHKTTSSRKIERSSSSGGSSRSESGGGGSGRSGKF